jgi:hypothetical protein
MSNLIHIIGSKNQRIEIRTSLDGIVMTPEEIAEEEKLIRQNKERKRKEKRTQPITQPNVTRDDNPPQATPTNGWLYVPSIGMEFSPDLEGFGTNWYDAHKLVKSKGVIMPSPEETWALIFEAKANLDKPEFRKIYEFFTKKTKGDIWHGEWQDAYFIEKGKKLYVRRLKDFTSKNKPIFFKGTDVTGEYLSSDNYADITQRSNITAQGLLNVKDSRSSYVEGENFYFWTPKNRTVAWFGVNSDKAYLYCDGDPTVTNASLGVRYARRVAPSVSALANNLSQQQSPNMSLSAVGKNGGE